MVPNARNYKNNTKNVVNYARKPLTNAQSKPDETKASCSTLFFRTTDQEMDRAYRYSTAPGAYNGRDVHSFTPQHTQTLCYQTITVEPTRALNSKKPSTYLQKHLKRNK